MMTIGTSRNAILVEEIMDKHVERGEVNLPLEWCVLHDIIKMCVSITATLSSSVVFTPPYEVIWGSADQTQGLF
jgi:hypothetical protein